MDQVQRAGVVTAVFLLVVATSAVLYYCASAAGRRQWKALEPKRQLLFVVCLIGWVSWVASTKVVRPWAAAIGLDGHWTLGVAPSFIAGITVTAFAAFVLTVARRCGPLTALFCGAAIMLLVELMQLWLPGYVFDPLDVLAGICGAALITIILNRFAPRAHTEADA